MAAIKYKIGSTGVNLIDIVWPIGSAMLTDPSSFLGGTWDIVGQPDTWLTATETTTNITSTGTFLNGTVYGGGDLPTGYAGTDYFTNTQNNCLGIKVNGSFLIQMRGFVEIKTSGNQSLGCHLAKGTSTSSMSNYENTSTIVGSKGTNTSTVLTRNVTATIPGPDPGTTLYGRPRIVRESGSNSISVKVYPFTQITINFITRSCYGVKIANTDGSSTKY